MKFDRPSTPDQKGQNRAQLLALQKTGQYVFHGSPDLIKTLEPRQAYAYDPTTQENIPDGAPAVYATPYADMAIFRALISEKNVTDDSESGFGVNDDKLTFTATQNLLDQARKQTAGVYVFNRAQFDTHEPIQSRAHTSVKPIKVIEVSFDDLPPNIKIIE